MSDIISESIGDPTDSDPDFPADPETGQPTSEAEGPEGAGQRDGAGQQDGDGQPDGDGDGVEPEEYASPTV